MVITELIEDAAHLKSSSINFLLAVSTQVRRITVWDSTKS